MNVNMDHKNLHGAYAAPRWKFIHSRTVHDMDDLPDAGGVYFGYNETQKGNLRLSYIGETNNFRRRLKHHEGSFTHIMILCYEMDADKRKEIEKRMIKQLAPECNIQHNVHLYQEEPGEDDL